MTEDEQKSTTLGLSTAQVVGSALAAATVAVVASWAGTAGTIAGAALGSVVATVGSATYTWSIRRTGDVVRRTAAQVPIARVQQQRTPRWGAALPWKKLGLASLVAAVVALGGITVVEAVGGKPVSSLTRGDGGGGTTVGHVLGQDDETPTRKGPTEPASPSPSPSTPATPSTSPSAEPTQDATPTPEPSPTPSSEPTPAPSPSASPTAP